VAAPANDRTNALTAAGSTRDQGIWTLRMNDRAAKVVPHTEESLFVPYSVAGGVSGSRFSRAGSWIRPPPPTAASTAPAKKANRHSDTRTTTKGRPSTRSMTESVKDRGVDPVRLATWQVRRHGLGQHMKD